MAILNRILIRKNMKYLWLMLPLVVWTMSCKTEDQSAVLNEKYQAIDDLHNEAMAVGMANYEPLSEVLQIWIDSAATDPNALGGMNVDVLIEAKGGLDQAYEDMMTWMKNHQNLDELEIAGLSYEAKVRHLDKDLAAITAVNESTAQSIETAKQLLTKLGVELTQGHTEVKHNAHDGHDHDAHDGHDH